MSSSPTESRWRIGEPPPAALLARQSYYEWLIVGVTCIGAFIGQLDGSIVQLALPALTVAFDRSVDDVRWVAITYPLAYAAFLPVFSRTCEIHGRKLLYLAGFAIFALSSLLCGFAPSLAWLVAFRVVQGVGGAMLGANSMAILVESIDDSRRAHAIGLYTTAQAIGVSVGPAAGGLLLEVLDWQWVFWVAVPFSLTAALSGWFILPRTHDLARDRRFDWIGASLLMPSLVLAILALNQVSVWPLTSTLMVLVAVGAVTLFALFAWRERVAPAPLVDFGLFSHRSFAAGVVGVSLSYALVFGMFFLMSFALIHGFHNSALLAGFKLAIIPVAMGITAPLGIAAAKKFGSSVVRVSGMALVGAALVALMIIGNHPINTLVTGLSSFAVFGVGLGLFMAPNNHATIDSAPPGRAIQAAAMLNLIRVFGSCVGVSAASSLMSWRIHQHDVIFGGRPLIDAVESSLALLVVFALIAAGASLVRSPKSAQS
jgi:EmrB/QacA subfamily drug resistance transporter